ncbi:YceI-like domain-containing protein [Christiangramia gaetbulicola]|uniref:YceI-like domain-containing protein n=1 Tax=Christiangramia gaetbulicola TaxID=703340 RepID=A0A2T6ACW5_9FLAO|nr:YceI family protein [Christiangramia gaetbulicola]PTX41648.1 YceI-like domain-containing protein [Christiangramia gaetbulicola]
MKRLLILSGLLFFSLILNAQKNFEKENIMILPDSELIISGKTNVNKFDCRFDIDLITQKRNIRYIQDEGFINFNNLKLNLLTKGFDCGHKRMNADFQDLLMCDKFPEIIIELDKIEFVSTEFVKAFITVHLAGKTKTYSLPVQTANDRFIGKFEMNIRDFGLEPPKKALGLIEVDEEIEVQFDLKISN